MASRGHAEFGGGWRVAGRPLGSAHCDLRTGHACPEGAHERGHARIVKAFADVAVRAVKASIDVI